MRAAIQQYLWHLQVERLSYRASRHLHQERVV
jgi:hypothetical protein